MKTFFNNMSNSISSFFKYLYTEHLDYIRLAIILLAVILIAIILLVLYLKKKKKEKNQSEFKKDIIKNLTEEEIENISKATCDGDFNPDELLGEIKTEKEENTEQVKRTSLVPKKKTTEKPESEPAPSSVENQNTTVETTENKQTKTTQSYTGKWIIYQENEKFRARLVASNGGTLIKTESYSSLSGVKGGIETIKKNVAEGNFATSIDKYGKYHFKLFSQNNRLICISEDYSTKAKCLKGIDSVKRFAHTAIVIKEEKQ